MAGLIPRTVREALAQQLTNNLQRVVGVHAYAPNGNDPDAVPGYPAILIGHAPDTDYQITFGAQGIAKLLLQVEARTWSADNGMSAEIALDDLFAIGTGANSSVYDAIMLDPTLGSTVENIEYVDVSPCRPISEGRWSFTHTIAVYARRSAP